MQEIELPEGLECLRCGHKWRPRKSTIRICPKCKSPYWDRPKRDKRQQGGKVI